MQDTLRQSSQLIETFLFSISSKQTQKLYLRYIKYFEDYQQGRRIEDLLNLDTKAIEEIIIRYIVFMRENNLSFNSIHGRLSAIYSFLELNDITLNRKKLKKFVGESMKTIKDEAYTHQDLLKMFEFSSFRTRLIIAIFTSTGIRKGALTELRLRHLKKIPQYNLYQFAIYENSKEEYITFCTPECASMIDEYIERRKRAGEKVTQESYLIRNEFDFNRRYLVRTVKPLIVNSLGNVMDRLLMNSELKQINPKVENYHYKRHTKATFHAFRKYFNTCLANCDVNLAVKERLMGHSIGLDDSYFRPTEKQLLTEYMKAVNELTINEENRLKKKVDELQVKYDRIDKLVARIEDLEKQLSR